MKFYRGGELFMHLKLKGRFSEKLTRFYAAQIAIGLSHLHKNNIIYRDMKPENILIDDEGNICLIDFGMSKILN
jgi:serum/glucocorticoid-regulated kinase 2